MIVCLTKSTLIRGLSDSQREVRVFMMQGRKMVTEIKKDEIIEKISYCILSAKDRLRWYESTNRRSYLTEANDYLKVMSEYVAQINGIYR